MVFSPLLHLVRVSSIVPHLFILNNQLVLLGILLYLPDKSPSPCLLSSLIASVKAQPLIIAVLCCSPWRKEAHNPYQWACPSRIQPAFHLCVADFYSTFHTEGVLHLSVSLSIVSICISFPKWSTQTDSTLFVFLFVFYLHVFSCTAALIMERNILFQHQTHSGLLSHSGGHFK